jgi:hypothetical protein
VESKSHCQRIYNLLTYFVGCVNITLLKGYVNGLELAKVEQLGRPL